MKNIRFFLSENCPFLVVKFSIHSNRRVLNRISHGTDSSRRCDKFDRIFHIRTKVKNTFCGFRVFNPNEFVTL